MVMRDAGISSFSGGSMCMPVVRGEWLMFLSTPVLPVYGGGDDVKYMGVPNIAGQAFS